MFVLAMLFLAKFAYAQEVMHLVVLEFSTVGEFDQTLLLNMSDQTRGAALDVFPKQTSMVQVLTRESLMDFVQQQGKDASCIEGECAVDIARNINARFAIVGNAYFQNGTYRVTMKAFDSASNQLLGQEELSAKSASDLLSQVEETSFKLIESTIGPFDPGRKGIQDFRPEPFEVSETPYRILHLNHELLPGATVEVPNTNATCQTDDRNYCSILIDTRKNTGSVDVFVSQAGYKPIIKTVKVSGNKTNIPVQFDFVPVYGILRVDALSPTGAKCRGTVEINGEEIGQTPLSEKILAKSHTLVVDCNGMRGLQEVVVPEAETISVEVSVQAYSSADYSDAQKKLQIHRIIDWGLIGTSGMTAYFAASNFSQSQQAFLDASSIQSANDSNEYQELLTKGTEHIQTTNLNLIVCGVSAGVGVVHYAWLTRQSKKYVEDIEDIRSVSQ